MALLQLEYRKIERADVEKIFRLGESEFAHPTQYSWDWSIPKVESYLDEESGSGIVCTGREELVGFVLAENNYSRQRPNVAWLTYLMVHPNYERNGIGQTLLEKIKDVLKSKGITEVITDIFEDNELSLRFFHKQGFSVKKKWFILARDI